MAGQLTGHGDVGRPVVETHSLQQGHLRTRGQDGDRGPAAARARSVARTGIRSVFQPVVDLDTMNAVGFEALVRGPAGSAMEMPDALFDAAGVEGTVAELDWACRETAVEMARAGGFRHPLSLFINAEPSALIATAAQADHWRSFRDLRCYTELTERALMARPAELLAAIEQIRRQDWGVALDDVGADESSLALMPLIRPDVVKLDRGLLDPDAGPGAATVIQSVLAWAADSGASVVAEGIETERQLDLARGYGVTLGQGFLLGRPAALPARLDFPTRPVKLIDRTIDRFRTSAPFAIVNSHLDARRVTTGTVRELGRQLLVRAASLDPPPAVFVIARAGAFDAEVTALLSDLADRCPVLAVASTDDLEIPGCRVSRLDPMDPARADTDVAVVSSTFAGVLTARRADQGSVDGTGAWDMLLSFDRALAGAAANALMTRIAPDEPAVQS